MTASPAVVGQSAIGSVGPSSTGVVEVREEGVLVRDVAVGPLVLAIEGHYVWSLAPARDGRITRGGVLVPWPAALRPFLAGVGRVRVTDPAGAVVHHDEEVAFGAGDWAGDAGRCSDGGAGAGRVAVVDPAGHPLCVDKVGHLARSFDDTAGAVRDEILAGTADALRDLREHAGVEAYLNYGALLGAVREGRMLAHDSDTDVCYLSRHASPADVITESYAVERVMRSRGWRLLRMSGGDIKLLLPLSDGRVCHIDVFVAFYVGGTFFQLGNRSGRLPVDEIVPVSEIALHGQRFPAPADPEAMLAFVYGPGWRVPDPAFRYDDPRPGVRRLDGWLRGFRTDMGRWTEFHQSPLAAEVSRAGSSFARWVAPQLAPGAAVLDVGTGTGRDARYLARRGHPVHAVDFSRGALGNLRARLRHSRRPITVGHLILGELRSTLHLGARLARDPHDVYVRGLLGCLDDAARDQLWLLCRMALRPHGGRLFVEFAASCPGAPPPPPAGLVRRLEPALVRAGIEAAGGVVEHCETSARPDLLGGTDPAVCRLRARWPAPGRSPR